MKKWTSLLLGIVLSTSLWAQNYEQSIRMTDGTERTVGSVEITEDSILFIDNRTLTSLSKEQISEVYFRTTHGNIWDVPFNNIHIDYHDSFGYGSWMTFRDMLTGDLTRPQNVYNHFDPLASNLVTNQYILIYNHWYGQWELVGCCNAFLEASASWDELRGMRGAAYASRALLYLDLAREYEFLPNDRVSGLTYRNNDVTGLTVPIIDENVEISGTQNKVNVPRATKSEMVAFILNDLDSAEYLLPSLEGQSKILPSMAAVYGLKARLYLWNEDYANARLWARKSIDASDVEPMTRQAMLSTTKGFNDLSQWIWGSQLLSSDDAATSGILNWTSWMSNEWNMGYAPYVNVCIDRKLYESIPDTDVRKLLWVGANGSQDAGDVPLLENSYSSLEPYASVKFRPANGSQERDGDLTAYPLMRVEEMYLIEAEAAAHLSLEEGRSLLQKFVSTYRDSEYQCTLTDADALIEEIIRQKRIELWGEGQTFFDIKRLNLSVARNYEGSNFPAEACFNTQGRPAWMNILIPKNISTYVPSLEGWENPGYAHVYEDGYVAPTYLTAEEASTAISATFDLATPAFASDAALPALAIDSIYGIMLRYTAPKSTVDDVTFIYDVEFSYDASFPEGETYMLKNYSQKGVNHSTIMEVLYALNQSNGIEPTKPQDLYIRMFAYPSCTRELVCKSNTISFKFQPISNEKMIKGYWGFKNYSYAGRLQLKSISTPVDMELLASEDTTQFMEVVEVPKGILLLTATFNYEDYNHDTPIVINLMHRYYDDETPHSYCSLNAEGYGPLDPDQLDIERANQNIREDGRYEYYGYCTTNTVYNDIICRYSFYNDEPFITFLRNEQREREMGYNFEDDAMFTLTSEMNAELNGRQTQLQKAKDTDGTTVLYRLVAPYQKGHNLLLAANGEQIVVDSQMAYRDANGQRVNVSGTGVVGDYDITLTLTFSTAAGTLIGTFTEVLATDDRNWNLKWIELGTGTLTENFIYSSTTDVTIMKCNKDANRFRVMAPFDGMSDQLSGRQSPYMDLEILQPGQKYGNVTITQNGLVGYDEVNTGFFHERYGGDICLHHPAYSYDDESYSSVNYVSEWQDNQLPRTIVLVAMYYIPNVGYFGWDENRYKLTISFPAVEN